MYIFESAQVPQPAQRFLCPPGGEGREREEWEGKKSEINIRSGQAINWVQIFHEHMIQLDISLFRFFDCAASRTLQLP